MKHVLWPAISALCFWLGGQWEMNWKWRIPVIQDKTSIFSIESSEDKKEWKTLAYCRVEVDSKYNYFRWNYLK